jgi:hypothetical protein
MVPRDAPDARAETLARRVQFESGLQIHPEVWRHAEVLAEAQRGVGR